MANNRLLSWFLAVVLTVVTIFVLQSISIERTIKFSVQNAESYGISLSGNPFDDFPPTCGCLQPRDGKWRGLSFATRQIHLRNLSKVENVFDIVATEPGRLMSGPSLEALDVTSYVIDSAYTEDMPFNFRDKENIYFSKQPLTEEKHSDELSINQGSFKTGLSIFSSGDFPIASWNPSTRGFLTITNRIDPVTNASDTTLIDEILGELDGQFEGGTGVNFDGGQLDFTGKTFYIWHDNIEDPKTSIVLEIKVPFSLRVNFREIKIGEQRPGKISISVQKMAVNDYQEIQKLKQNNPMTSAIFDSSGRRVINVRNEVERIIPDGELHATELRQPDIPPREGFNLYGDVSSLRMSGADGAIMFGSDQRSFANADVNFSGLARASLMGKKEFLPLAFDAGGFSGLAKFSGKGVVSIEGDNLNSIFNWLSQIFMLREIWFVCLGWVLFCGFLLGRRRARNSSTVDHA